MLSVCLILAMVSQPFPPSASPPMSAFLRRVGLAFASFPTFGLAPAPSPRGLQGPPNSQRPPHPHGRCFLGSVPGNRAQSPTLSSEIRSDFLRMRWGHLSEREKPITPSRDDKHNE